MKKLHTLLTYISSNRVWLITLVCLDLFFVFLAWVAYPGDFLNLVSPLVHTRMLYVRDHTRQNVEQILYFSRLGAVHKDYYFEPLPILETCKEAVKDNLSLLEEAHFSVTYSGNNCTAISDKKGFMFILGQIISNSVKYAAHDATPAIHFSVSDNKEIGQIVLSICDNGTGIPASDLPFVFDKGFTGDVGSYLSRSTGMGLYLVQLQAMSLAHINRPRLTFWDTLTLRELRRF